MIDVLLINAITSKHVPAYIPNGLLWVAAVLREQGFDVQVYDRNADDRDLAALLKELSPRIVGVSVLTGGVILDAIHVSQVTRDVLPSAQIVWGGLHPTLFPNHVLAETYVDYIVMGEGEYPMRELAAYLLHGKGTLSGINNIGFRVDGKVQLTPLRDFIDMDGLPMPAFDLIPMEKYFIFRPYARRTVCVMSSRGCPFNCTFCYNKKVNRGRWRGMSAKKLLELVTFFKSRYNATGFLFHDDNFDANAERLREFCRLLIEGNVGITWEHFSRVNYAERDRLQLEQKAGCRMIAYGLESGSERILKIVKKGQTVAQIENAIRLCAEVGISTGVGSIIGYPFETEDDLNETLRLFEKLRPTHIFTTIYNPYPGSELYDYVIEKGLFKEPSTLERQGQIYAVGNVELNMSPIPNDVLKKIITKYFTYNLVNEIKDYLRFFNFSGLFLAGMNYLSRPGVVRNIFRRWGDMAGSLFKKG